MTNLGLMKRYFSKKAKVGDKSKSLVIEPHYALIFTDRLTYQWKVTPRVVAWLPPGKEIFNVYERNSFSDQIGALLLDLIPEDSHVIRMQDDLCFALNILNRLAANIEPEFTTDLITRLNCYLEAVTEKDIWEIIDQNSDSYSALWTTGRELPDIDNKVGVEIITRRLMS